MQCRSRSFLFRTLWLGPLVISTAACDSSSQRDSQAEQPAPQQQPASETPPAQSAASRFEDTSYELSIAPVQDEFTAGQPGAVRIVLEAKPPYKVNQEYPYKFKLEQVQGVQPATRELGREAMTIEPERAQFELGVTPRAAGQHRLVGTFSFSVCTDENCLIERRKLALELDAK